MYGQPDYIYPGGGFGGFYPPPAPNALPQPRGQQMNPPAQGQPQGQGQNFAWVNSEQEAQGWVVLPGQSMMLMSRNDSVFWIKATDQSGMPQPMRAFDYVERLSGLQAAPPAPQSAAVEYVPREEYNALAARVDALEGAKARKPRKAETEDGDNG